MFQSNIDSDFSARQEHYKDLLREAEHNRLIQIARPQQNGNQRMQGKVAGWIGDQMVKWGSKLQLL
jgi:hypothetical protein